MGRKPKESILDDLPRMYSIEDLASYFQLSKVTLITRCKKYPHTMPPFINIGTEKRPLYRFPAQDFKDFIKVLIAQKGVALMTDVRLTQEEEEQGIKIATSDDDDIFNLPAPDEGNKVKQ